MPQDEQTPQTQPEEAHEDEAHEDEERKELLDDLDPDEDEAEDVQGGGTRVPGRWDARY